MVLEIKNVTKQFNKQKKGLADYSLTIEKGILGLLGPNGAGKSTLMKIIATISKPTSGTVFFNGEDIVQNPDYIRRVMGYLPQDFGVYPNLNAYEFLEYIAAMKGVGGKGLKQRIEMLLEGVNLIADAKKNIGTYSGGMKQRIGIAQALINDPKVLIFDEPTVGLDPEERVRFRQLISELAAHSIVILSSHIVSDIDSIADQVAIMRQGRLIAIGEPKHIMSQANDKIFETLIDSLDLLEFKGRYRVIDSARQNDQVRVRYISNLATMQAFSVPVKASLEDSYLYLTHSSD